MLKISTKHRFTLSQKGKNVKIKFLDKLQHCEYIMLLKKRLKVALNTPPSLWKISSFFKASLIIAYNLNAFGIQFRCLLS